MSGKTINRRTMMTGSVAAAMLLPRLGIGKTRDPVVACAAGRFSGVTDQRIQVFRGIRYGIAERFQAPRAAPVPQAVIRAIAYGPSCLQSSRRIQPASEDPLFLNIWTPELSSGARKPVMFYIHGGAYSSGTSVDPLLDGQRLAAAGDVVVVTVNHRLNAFGYLYLAPWHRGFEDSGNAGQLDLMLALRWVQQNIAAFGGDPNRVTAFGQSGGGAKIATLMGTPAAAGLFHRAITMSGQQVTASGPLNATRRTRAFLDHLNVKDGDLTPLVSMPAERLVEALQVTDPVIGSGGVYFGPVLDMKWLTRHPFWPDANPQSRTMPMMLGNTHDEARAFFPPDSPKLAGLHWDNLAERLAPEMRIDILPEWVVAQYRAHYPDWNPREVFWGVVTAARSWRGQVIEAEERARADSPTWVYQVNFASPEPERGAPHTMDIALAFGTLEAPGSFTGTSDDARKASRGLMNAFVAFATTGNPDLPGQSWPQYRLETRATLIVDATPRIENNPRQWERELFARVPYIQQGT